MATKTRRGWRSWGLLALTPVLVPSLSAAATSHILGLRFGGDATDTRIVIDLDGPIGAPGLVRDGDTALRLYFPVVSDGAQTGRGRGLVTGWTSATTVRGESLRFDLVGTVRIARRFMIPPSDGVANYRYVLDLAPSAPATDVRPLQPVVYQPAPPVRVAPTVTVSPEIAPSVVRVAASPAPRMMPTPIGRTDHRRKVVVVDAGHGGHDSGAIGATRQEKDLTLAAAETLKSRLERSGRYRVILTRESDVFIPLETRVKIARDGGADLFISLHADSAGGDAATHGASVYTLSDSGGGRVHYVLGRNEWFSKVANRTDAGTSQILLDLTQRSTRNRSATFAELLLDRLAGRVDLLPSAATATPAISSC